MKKLIIVIVSILFITGCGGSDLADGSKIIAKIDGKEITADELYEDLKTSNGANVMINMIDEYIVNDMVETDDEALDYVQAMIDMYKNQYGEENWDELLVSSGFPDQKAFEDVLLLNYKRERAIQMFIMESLDEEAVQTYYDEKTVGPMDVRHILIKPSEDAEDQEAELEKAKAEAEEIIEKLNDGEDFSELAKEYSDDSSAEEGGAILGVTYSGFVEEFVTASLNLEIDEYTKEPVKSMFGYHIIIKDTESEKPSFEDAEEEIRTTLAEEIINSDSEAVQTYWKELRKKYNLEISDSELKSIYNNSNNVTE